MAETKYCPYCAEEIQAAAIRCRYCRSRLTAFDRQHWHRSHRQARLAGVCAALASALTVPVTVVRLAFVVLTFFHLLGPILYGALWLLLPEEPGGESPLEGLLKDALRLLRRLGDKQPDPPPPTPKSSFIDRRTEGDGRSDLSAGQPW